MSWLLLTPPPTLFPTTSLAFKSETEVAFPTVSTPPPPSRAKARRRWHSPPFRPRSVAYHLPRVQLRDGGGVSWGFDPVRTPTTSLACKSETEVASRPPASSLTPIRPRSGPHHLPRVQKRDGGGVAPPAPPFDPIRPRSGHHHLPRVQKRDGGGLAFEPVGRFTTSLA